MILFIFGKVIELDRHGISVATWRGSCAWSFSERTEYYFSRGNQPRKVIRGWSCVLAPERKRKDVAKRREKT